MAGLTVTEVGRDGSDGAMGSVPLSPHANRTETERMMSRGWVAMVRSLWMRLANSLFAPIRLEAGSCCDFSVNIDKRTVLTLSRKNDKSGSPGTRRLEESDPGHERV